MSVPADLPQHHHDMQDIELAIQESRLWMLQCRVGERTGIRLGQRRGSS
jgi:pyruvate,orthophosphate dikinase